MAVAENGITLEPMPIHTGEKVNVSLHDKRVYLGSCRGCKELCGVGMF